MRFVIVPGNGGCGNDVAGANWYGWLSHELRSRNHLIELKNFPDPYVAKQDIWLPFIRNELLSGVDDDTNTVVIGHSSGALALMRLLETIPLFGAILVSAAHTDLGDENERASGYFDTPWDWEAQKQNAKGFYHQFHSVDDHLIPVEEARYVASQLKSEKHEYQELTDQGHFFGPFKEILEVIDKYCS